MTYTQAEIRDFCSRLSSLGGSLGFEKSSANQYIDIEEFFLRFVIFQTLSGKLQIIENNDFLATCIVFI